MGRAYAQDLRERVMAAVDSGTRGAEKRSCTSQILEQIPSGLNREGFPNQVGRDSSCMLEKEASMHGSSAVFGRS